MRALLIDPFAQDVTEIEGDFTNIDEIYRAIDASLFDIVRFDGYDVFVDDEGLYDSNKTANMFWHAECPSPLAGKGLVLSCNDEGETIACPDWLSADDLRRKVTFTNLDFAVMILAA